jgi:transcriptional regulator with XRE-family HTH domain
MQIKSQDIGPFAERLRLERMKLRMTQTDMAQLAGVSKTSQISYESGGSLPDASYLAKLAEGGLDVQWLLVGRRTPVQDWDLAAEIFELIEEWSVSRNRPTSTTEKFALLENLYRQFSADQHIDEKAVARTLKLVSGEG